jgi:hypothetical protein
MTDYTLVVAVDKQHLEQLSWTWPTWKKHKSSLLDHKMVVIYDRDQVTIDQVGAVVDHSDMMTVPWPPIKDVKFKRISDDRWGDPHRYRMLSSFVHVPGMFVNTKYWLKIDTDTVATGQDSWIDEEWFKESPGIVSQPWGYTKPPDQMLKLDAWAAHHRPLIETGLIHQSMGKPLGLKPKKPDATLVRHKRIISWCAFFRTDLTKQASMVANATCGFCQLPVPSQDGFIWYWAARMGYDIVRSQMKRRGWEHWMTKENIIKASQKAMGV